MPSVLREWVMELPLREQGTLLTVIRGCDLTPKYPLDSLERRTVAALRYAICIPADAREVDSEPGCFMSAHIPMASKFKFSAFGQYPQHYVAHLIHAIEVLGYRHPNQEQRDAWHSLYLKGVDSLHLMPESRDHFIKRLSEDRIANNTVVS